MAAIELHVTVYEPTHSIHDIASAIRTVLEWSEKDSPYICVGDPKDESVFYYAKRD